MLKPPFILFIITVPLFVYGIYCYSEWLAFYHEEIRNIGLAIAAMIGFPLIAWRTHIANQQTKISNRQATVSEANHISDMYTSAITQIGSENDEGEASLELRIGGLYALEQIAKKNIDYHQQIMEVLSAYIRLHAPSYGVPISKSSASTSREDVKVALKIIGRRNVNNDGPNPIVLSKILICGIDLTDSDFSNTEFIKSSFFNTTFNNTSLKEANLRGAGFHNSVFKNVNMCNAILLRTKFSSSSLEDCNLTEIDGRNCEFAKCMIQGSKFNNATIVESKFHDSTVISDTTYTAADISKADFSGCFLGHPPVVLADVASFCEAKPSELLEEIQEIRKNR